MLCSVERFRITSSREAHYVTSKQKSSRERERERERERGDDRRFGE